MEGLMKKNDWSRWFAALAIALPMCAMGCGGGDGDGDGDGDGESACEVTPGDWSADDFDANAAEALALRAALDNLQSDVMNTAEQSTWGDAPTDAPDLQALQDAYEAGSPSLADVTPGPLDAVIQQTFEDWTAAMAQDPATYAFISEDGSEWIAEGEGGVYERPPADDGTRRFRAYSASGVELRQIVDKGLFVGAMYNYALSLTEGDITPATVQAIAAAWGANPTLDPNPPEGDPGNTDTAHYARSMGLYDEIANALTEAQAYAGDEACTAERDAAIVDVFRTWEEAAFARGTYYGAAPLRGTIDATDPETVLGPLHGAAEGWGLIVGMLGMPDPASGPLSDGARVSTDDDIRAVLEAQGVNIDDISAGTSGEWLVESLSSYEDGFNTEFKDVVQSVFEWNDDLFEEYAYSPVPTE